MKWALEDWAHKNDVIQQVNQLLSETIKHHVSDIHIEPYAHQYRIRVRQDGLLYVLVQLDSALADRIIARLKVLGHLDVAEKRLPQDGHFKFNSHIDLRLSTCPTTYGEKLVVRILNPETLIKDIIDLGLEKNQEKIFLSALNQPQGLILFIGPTGSGKTVSLYAALKQLDPLKKNILTIEDPIEINISGLNQVNINEKIGLTFASGLRTFLRQDPDVIMVGEIRDSETAQTVIKAAQTGHLILSTLHAQNTTQAFSRLRNLQLSDEQIQNNLLLLVAQRLVRKLCNNCKTPYQFKTKNNALLNDHTIFKPIGCDHCHLGYTGRTGIFELLPITPEIIDAFSKQKYLAFIKLFLKKQALSLRISAEHKVIQGLTSIEEINRIIPKEITLCSAC